MNYKIIKDEKKLRDFIDWLPDLEENEKYYVSLFSRRKYSSQVMASDKSQLKRFCSYKSTLFDKIKQLECELGSYRNKGGAVPEDSLVLYINPNPRNMRKATFNLIKKAVDILECNGKGYNIHAEAMSCIQRSKSKSHFCDFDIDDTSIDLSLMDGILEPEHYDVLQTRGGFHILVNTRTAPKGIKWHQLIRDAYKVDQVGDQLIPVPGCTQGLWVPTFLPKRKL